MSSKIYSRREFVKQGFGALAATPTMSLTSSAQNSIQSEQLLIRIPELPEALHGLKIGFLTDIHLSAFLPAKLVEDALSMISEFKPDILLLGGDYIWNPQKILRNSFPIHRPELSDFENPNLTERIYQELIDKIASISTPPLGIYAVMGNHDHWLEPATCKRVFAKSPINLLINQIASPSRNNSPIEIFGCDDYLTGLPRLMSKSPSPEKQPLRILLTHNPDILPWYFAHSPVNFSLAFMGHTHGGQICPFPGVALSYNIADRRYGAGLCLHESGCQCYTSRGLGMVGIPLRVNCPSEVTLATLTPGAMISLR